ncbi:MAG: NtaA/DmoA family FMN-dependent monooxygenase [Microbacteriaceae bacterium]
MAATSGGAPPARAQIVLGAVLTGVGGGTDAELWRHPEVPTTASVDIDWYTRQALEAESRGFDFVFIVDSQFIDATFPPHHLNRLEPLTLLAAVAARTSRIGLAATVSTSYSEPWDIARRLASLDVISGGRAAWNIVTSMDARTARNFGRAAHGAPEDRYRRARESIEVVRGLWDSYEDDAFATDKSAERFLDPSKLHALDHEGEHFSVAGPLNIQRSAQGQPVLIQAGTSDAGRELSAAVADLVFSFARSREEAAELARDVTERAAAYGRSRAELLFVPALLTTIADTAAEARELRRRRVEAVPLERRLAPLRRAFDGHEFTEADLDRPLAEVVAGLGAGSSSTGRKTIAEAVAAGHTLREHLEDRQDHWAHFVGTAEDVADEIERWVDEGWVDGFNHFVHEPEQWRLFRDRVVPVLVERGRFRGEYAAATLRGHLGLPFVENRHTAARASVVQEI